MKVLNIKLSDIKPYENNPRKNDGAVDAVAESIKQCGYIAPIIVDEDNVILAGHTRYKALKKLKRKEAECVVKSGLTEEQKRKYRLLDNKTNEFAEWNLDLLAEELDGMDFGDFDFDLEFNKEIQKDIDEREKQYYGAERERTFDAYNLYDVNYDNLTDKWQMPILRRCDYIPKDLLSFNYAKTSNEYDKGIHFYIDDYQFERIWNAPHKYMELLSQFACCLTPDFSLYTEMPLPIMIWNIYRSRLIGQIMQDYGITVIPTLQWCREDTYDFAFDGIEQGCTVSVSTIGVKTDQEAKSMWENGMKEAMRRIKPKNVIVYGGNIGFDFGKTNVKYINNHNAERFKENGNQTV